MKIYMRMILPAFAAATVALFILGCKGTGVTTSAPKDPGMSDPLLVSQKVGNSPFSNPASNDNK